MNLPRNPRDKLYWISSIELKVENKKNKKAQESDSEESFYTEEEIKLLDKFHQMTGNNFVDDEIYDIMVKFKNDEELIENELKEMLKELKRGEEYGWTEIGKNGKKVVDKTKKEDKKR